MAEKSIVYFVEEIILFFARLERGYRGPCIKFAWDKKGKLLGDASSGADFENYGESLFPLH